jgi:hypothetical protein
MESIRQISVGDSSYTKYYVKGSTIKVLNKPCKITDFIPSKTKENYIDIYIQDGNNKLKWKSLNMESDNIKEVEYDLKY